MNKKIIVIVILLLLIITGSFIVVLLYKSKSPSPSTTCKENNDRFYDFKEIQLGSDILKSIREGFKFIRSKISTEYFALSSGIISLNDIKSGKAILDPTKQYYRGIRNTTSTIKPQSNGGKGCAEYPDVVFKEVPPAKTISGTNGWKYVKDIGVLSAVKLNSNGDIICASNNGSSCLFKSEADLLIDINNPSYSPATTVTCNKFQYTQGSFTEKGIPITANPCNLLIPTLKPFGPNYKESVLYKNNVLSNQGPCSSFTDSSDKVNLDCIKHIWTNLAGCPNYRDDIINYYYSMSQNNGLTKANILKDAQAWAYLTSDIHRTLCYGTDKTKWPTL